jgi:dephospho-CoA kinase
MKIKPIVGILGGIGSGKSTVANQFANLGCAVIEADKIAHDVIEEQGIIDTISAVFGSDVLSSDGIIDRSKLAARVFEDAEQLEKLQTIVHPPVVEICQRLLTQYLSTPSVPAVILDVPLLLESGFDKRCNVLIFVESPPQQRFARAAARKGLTEDQIKKRENFQISLDKKRQIAHYIIKNNSGLSDLTEQVVQIYSAMMAM